ncbi:MAG: heat-inducible transcription repressor HrcA [Clostridiales bacterium]|nr:MAG: heat-inducible transcription repressor HrcA [Clostridiales bacterium]
MLTPKGGYVDLGNRKLSILKVIIDDYINTGMPVGSRTISKRPDIAVSSATIRNEMADLEELGYLLQPHTSSGRIPSDFGYRLYVNLLSNQNVLSDEERNLLRSLLISNTIELEDVIKHTLGKLTKLTKLTTVISLPLFKKSRLENMKLVKVNSRRVILILVSDTGVVKDISLPISECSQEMLDILSNSLLNKFKNSTIDKINVKDIYAIKNDLNFDKSSELIEYLLPLLRDSLKEIKDFELYVSGTHNIFDIKEFSDVKKAKQFFDLISNKDLLFDALKDAEDNMIIKIGSENKYEELKELTLIAAPYKFNGVNDGRIGIIGPTRMDYDRAISAVNYTADILTNIFSGINL